MWCGVALAILGVACGDDDGGEVDGGELLDAGTDASFDASMEVDAGPSFLPGPYGDGFYERVGPFVVPTLGAEGDGELDFEATFDGSEHYLFSLYLDGNDYAERLWNHSILEYPLEDAPPNTHFVFLAARDPDGTDRAREHVTALRDRFETVFAEQEGAAFVNGDGTNACTS